MDDFSLFMSDIGLTKQQLDCAVHLVPTPIPKRSGEQYTVGHSQIQGTGIFLTHAKESGDRICILKSGARWTIAGRFMNHAKNPNCKVSMDGEALIASAITDIAARSELTVNYRHIRTLLEKHNEL